MTYSVAVITPTIGRASLANTLASVANQSYPCTHYVIVDGEQYALQASQILQCYPNVKTVFLPVNTGANGWCNSRINALAAALVEEDIVCYLDDDNTYQPDHIHTLVRLFNQSDCDFAFSWRNFVTETGAFLCQDRTENLGWYQTNLNTPQTIRYEFAGKRLETTLTPMPFPLIDTNCYAFKLTLARKLMPIWLIRGDINDQMIFQALQANQMKGECSEQFSVDYQLDPKKVFAGKLYQQLRTLSDDERLIRQKIYQITAHYNNAAQILI